MQRIKIFPASFSGAAPEAEINNFLSSLNADKILDVKFNTVFNPAADGVKYSACVVYEESEDYLQ